MKNKTQKVIAISAIALGLLFNGCTGGGESGNKPLSSLKKIDSNPYTGGYISDAQKNQWLAEINALRANPANHCSDWKSSTTPITWSNTAFQTAHEQVTGGTYTSEVLSLGRQSDIYEKFSNNAGVENKNLYDYVSIVTTTNIATHSELLRYHSKRKQELNSARICNFSDEEVKEVGVARSGNNWVHIFIMPNP